MGGIKTKDNNMGVMDWFKSLFYKKQEKEEPWEGIKPDKPWPRPTPEVSPVEAKPSAPPIDPIVAEATAKFRNWEEYREEKMDESMGHVPTKPASAYRTKAATIKSKAPYRFIHDEDGISTGDIIKTAATVAVVSSLMDDDSPSFGGGSFSGGGSSGSWDDDD